MMNYIITKIKYVSICELGNASKNLWCTIVSLLLVRRLSFAPARGATESPFA